MQRVHTHRTSSEILLETELFLLLMQTSLVIMRVIQQQMPLILTLLEMRPVEMLIMHLNQTLSATKPVKMIREIRS